MRMTMDRKVFGQLPSLDRPNAAAQMRRNGFPAVEAIRSRGIEDREIWHGG
jgi:hypothetical protein